MGLPQVPPNRKLVPCDHAPKPTLSCPLPLPLSKNQSSLVASARQSSTLSFEMPAWGGKQKQGLKSSSCPAPALALSMCLLLILTEDLGTGWRLVLNDQYKVFTPLPSGHFHSFSLGYATIP